MISVIQMFYISKKKKKKKKKTFFFFKLMNLSTSIINNFPFIIIFD